MKHIIITIMVLVSSLVLNAATEWTETQIQFCTYAYFCGFWDCHGLVLDKTIAEIKPTTEYLKEIRESYLKGIKDGRKDDRKYINNYYGDHVAAKVFNKYITYLDRNVYKEVMYAYETLKPLSGRNLVRDYVYICGYYDGTYQTNYANIESIVKSNYSIYLEAKEDAQKKNTDKLLEVMSGSINDYYGVLNNVIGVTNTFFYNGWQNQYHELSYKIFNVR